MTIEDQAAAAVQHAEALCQERAELQRRSNELQREVDQVLARLDEIAIELDVGLPVISWAKQPATNPAAITDRDRGGFTLTFAPLEPDPARAARRVGPADATTLALLERFGVTPIRSLTQQEAHDLTLQAFRAVASGSSAGHAANEAPEHKAVCRQGGQVRRWLTSGER